MPSKTNKKPAANPRDSHGVGKKAAARTPESVAPPQWPALEPLVPTGDLRLEVLAENQIVIIRNFFTSKLCQRYVSFLAEQPLTTTPAKPKAGDAVRVNDRVQFDDFAFSERLWQSTGLVELLQSFEVQRESAGGEGPGCDWGGNLCGLNPRIRVYRYSEGQFFGQHYDESNVLTLPSNPPTPVKTTWTLLIYLTGISTGCMGGETVFYPDLGPAKKFSGKSSEESSAISVEPEVGMALLHKHGQDCLLHEGKKVLQGEKWVLRSDICVKR